MLKRVCWDSGIVPLKEASTRMQPRNGGEMTVEIQGFLKRVGQKRGDPEEGAEAQKQGGNKS